MGLAAALLSIAVAAPASSTSPRFAAASAVVLDVAELATGLDADLVRRIDGRGLVDSANFVAAVQAEDPVLLDPARESDTVEVEEAEGQGPIIRSVAQCAPRGRDAQDLFTTMRNHGAFVSAATQGRTVEVDGASYDLSTLDGATAFCAHVEATGGGTRAARAAHQGTDEADRETAKAERKTAKADRKAAKAEAKAGAQDHPAGLDARPGRGHGGGPPAHAKGPKD